MADNLQSTLFAAPTKGMVTAKPLLNLDPLEAQLILNYDIQAGYLQRRWGLQTLSKPGETAVPCGFAAFDTTKGIAFIQWGTTLLVNFIDWVTPAYSTLASVANSINCRWVNFKGNILMCAGSSHYRYDGTSLTAIWTTPPVAYSLGIYQKRIYMGNTGKFYYGAPDSYTGTLKSYDTTSLDMSGDIVFVGGVDGFIGGVRQTVLGVVDSTGKVLFFQGEYPGSTSWILVGRHQIPIPQTAFQTVSYIRGNPVITTAEGLIDLNALFQTGDIPSSNITLNLKDQFQLNAATFTQGSYDWKQNVFTFGMAITLPQFGYSALPVMYRYNPDLKAWSIAIPSSSHELYNTNIFPTMGLGSYNVNHRFMGKLAGSNYLAVAKWNAVNLDDETVAAAHSAFTSAVYHAYKADDMTTNRKMARFVRPITQQAATAVLTGTCGVLSDFQAISVPMGTGTVLSGAMSGGKQNVSVTSEGFYHAPYLTGISSGSNDIRYLGSMMLWEKGSKL